MAKKNSTNDNYYVNNQELLEEIILYKKTGIYSDNLGKMLMKIAQRYSGHGSFSGYTWKQDMISNALCTCLKYIKNFNPEKSSNAFSYVTQIIGNAFKLTIIEEKKLGKIKNICFKGTMLTDPRDEAQFSQQAIDYESILKKVPEYMYDDTNDFLKLEDIETVQESINYMEE